MKRRLLHIAIAVDQLLYVLITLGAGMPDETMSAAAWRTEQKGRLGGRVFRPLIDWLFWRLLRERDHCSAAHRAELERAQSPRPSGQVERLR